MIVQNHFMLPQESIADNTIYIKQCILAFYVLPACHWTCETFNNLLPTR